MDRTRDTQPLSLYKGKFNALLTMVQTLDAASDLPTALDTVTADLTTVMAVRAASVKLLSDDGRFLRFVAGHGLPSDFMRNAVVEVAKSPLNHRIIQGEPFATGRVTQREMFQFGEDLATTQIQSVLFAPLIVRNKVIGILGAYCIRQNRFIDTDVEFFRLAAGLVALGIENRRSREAVEKMIEERSRFMLRVAHNLRAPLAALLSMLEVLREQHLGPLNSDQAEYLRRVDRRTRTMLTMINDLLTLSTTRTVKQTPVKQPLAPDWLAGRLQRTFHDSAAEKNLRFTVRTAPNLPALPANADMLEQILENLVSNAIKYTPPGGRVDVDFFLKDDAIGIDVRDTGIGIPGDSRPKVFDEFYRAPNAKEMEETGSGLGLAIVREYICLHGGDIAIESAAGQGTVFHVVLPGVEK